MAKDKNIKNKKSLFVKLRYKYRLVILNEDTFEQKASLRLSRMNLYVLSSVLFFVVVSAVTAVIAFTPLKYYMPGVGSVDVRTQLIEMEMITDSMQRQLDKRDIWLMAFQKALSGELDSTFFLGDSLINEEYGAVDIDEVSPVEQGFREEMASEVAVKNTGVNTTMAGYGIAKSYPLRFITPALGTVISEYDELSGHRGIDIAGEENEFVRATESGVVFLADWNPETGYVIGIQHQGNTLSFYKHNAALLKKVGNFVERGEAVALMGNTGHLSNGPHLHFELWQNGKTIDPMDFMVINTIN